MEVEHDVRMIPMGDQNKFQSDVEALAQDGWQLVPGFPPVVIYHLVREIRPPDAAIDVKFGIDDSKIGILHADGTMS